MCGNSRMSHLVVPIPLAPLVRMWLVVWQQFVKVCLYSYSELQWKKNWVKKYLRFYVYNNRTALIPSQVEVKLYIFICLQVTRSYIVAHGQSKITVCQSSVHSSARGKHNINNITNYPKGTRTAYFKVHRSDLFVSNGTVCHPPIFYF